MNWIVERSDLLDRAILAAETFAEMVVTRPDNPAPNKYGAKLHLGSSGVFEGQYKHVFFSIEPRPIINSFKQAAVEFHVTTRRGDRTVDICTFYLVVEDEAFFDNPEGDGNHIATTAQALAIDSIGKWVCDRMEEIGLFKPRRQAAGIFV